MKDSQIIEYMRIDLNNGNLGVGTMSPKSKLDLGSNYSAPSTYPNKITLWSSGENNYFGFGVSSGSLDYLSQGNHRFFTEYNGTPGSEKMVIMSNGNVGIGITDPGNYKFNVWGKIRAHEIVVNTSGADFVFDNSYKLMPLKDLEDFITSKKHLPEIAPAIEMEKNGADLGILSTKLLQKIEELTLYTIEQNKKIMELENRIELLKTTEKKRSK